jgi:hypothetical protein
MIARGLGEAEITKRASYFRRAGTVGEDNLLAHNDINTHP